MREQDLALPGTRRLVGCVTDCESLGKGGSNGGPPLPKAVRRATFATPLCERVLR